MCFVLRLIIGDNLGLNKILGFSTSFNSNFYCRDCKREKKSMDTDTIEITEDLRTIIQYENDVKVNNVHQTGIIESSIFNQIPSYHIIDNHSFDIMHDLFKGIRSYNMCHIIRYCIGKNYFSLEILNSRKNQFGYGIIDIGNIPPDTPLNHLKLYKIKMSASEMMNFGNFFPIFIGDLVPITDDVWKYFTLFLKIIDLCLISKLSIDVLNDFKQLVAEHHRMYVSLFNDNLKPKHHFLVHYATSILK